MPELSSKFTRRDLETLIEAVGDWELVGSQEFIFLQQVKEMPLPPEDHEAFEICKRTKEYYLQRERAILLSREQRAEDAVFLKAKLMMIRKEMQIADLFTMETEQPEVTGNVDKLKLAEHFIEDLGVWKHYENFLNSLPKQ
jgi:hypothetical protein